MKQISNFSIIYIQMIKHMEKISCLIFVALKV